ncbi:MAG: hypothetical protein IJV00_02535 [Clostridia bacterium]|nr:hypothetical protein [Clostridia bacterium]
MCFAAAGCGASQDGRPAQGNQGKSVNDVLNEKMNESTRAADSSSDQSKNDSSPTSQVVDDAPVESVKENTIENPSEQSQNDTSSVTQPVDAGPVDVDLTKLSSTMVYSEVYNMTYSPEDYTGKRVRMRGSFAYAEGDGRYYFACIIADATACCAQGIEFVLKDERKFPDEYPAEGAEITVVGVFETYNEGTFQYCQLTDAVME